MFTSTFAVMSEDAAGLTATFGFAGLALYFAWKSGYKKQAWDLVFCLGLLAVFLTIGGLARVAAIT